MDEMKYDPPSSRAPALFLIVSIAATIWWLLAGPGENYGINGTPGSIAPSCWVVFLVSLVEHAWRQRKRHPDAH
jgi:hypothetical protein